MIMDNCGISLREMIEIVAFGDTFIVHCPLRIVNFYRNEGAVNRNLPEVILWKFGILRSGRGG